MAKYLISEKHPKAKIVCPVNTTHILTKIAEDNGSEIIHTKVGSVEVSREMVKQDAIIGMEENGGFMYGVLNQVRDGALTTALMLDLLASEGKPSQNYSLLFLRFTNTSPNFNVLKWD